MPLFEYRCRTCVADFELLVRNQEQPSCPTCGSVSIDKLFSATAAPAAQSGSLPLVNGCPPGEAPCSPMCCRLPQ